ncbi:MAG: VOC family protein [Candidatus Cloacimonetes bacterium]|nr:VOC family protein [Candidatus Cloacimonadota bacterium]
MSHIEVYVSDLKRSTLFWDWFLAFWGYKVHQEWERGKSWIKGMTYIVLVQTEHRYQKYPYHRCHTGLNHIAFFADDKTDIDRFTKELRRKGIPILYEERHPYAGGEDNYAVYFEDPDRIKLEVVLAPKASHDKHI